MSDPKRPDDTAPDRPSDGHASSAQPSQAAFVVPYESIDEDIPPPPASVIVRQSYANEVPPVVARPQKQPGEDEPTTRVEAIDDAALKAEMAAEEAETHELPTPDDDDDDDESPPAGPTRPVAVVTDADLEDEEALGSETLPEGGPAVIVDGPSEAFASHGADRCPYCLTFVGLSNARSRGVRYCPMCGADWNSLDRAVEAPSGAVIPLGEDALPPPGDALEDHPTNEFTRLGPIRPAPGEPGFVAPPEPARRGANPWLMLLTGVSLGLAGTMTMAWLYARRQPPPPAVVSAPPPAPKVSPPVVQTPIDDAPRAGGTEPAPTAPAKPQVEPKTAEPKTAEPKTAEPTAVEPKTAAPKPARPTGPETVEPVVTVSEDMVQAALLDATSLLPPRALVEVRPRIDGDIVFLTGVVDSTDTLGHVVSAVAAVDGVRAVDSRSVRPAWKTYTVVKGDSLSRIAQLYYGDTNAWPRIFRANRETVKTPSGLHPGMKLRIPMGAQR